MAAIAGTAIRFGPLLVGLGRDEAADEPAQELVHQVSGRDARGRGRRCSASVWACGSSPGAWRAAPRSGPDRPDLSEAWMRRVSRALASGPGTSPAAARRLRSMATPRAARRGARPRRSNRPAAVSPRRGRWFARSGRSFGDSSGEAAGLPSGRVPTPRAGSARAGPGRPARISGGSTTGSPRPRSRGRIRGPSGRTRRPPGDPRSPRRLGLREADELRSRSICRARKSPSGVPQAWYARAS